MIRCWSFGLYKLKWYQCGNVASSEMVMKLVLVKTTHPKPCTPHWLDDANKVKVTKQVRVGLTIGSSIFYWDVLGSSIGMWCIRGGVIIMS